MKIYISSSWKNRVEVRALAISLREAGHEVYDFTDPACRMMPEIPPEKFPQAFDPDSERYAEYIDRPEWRFAVMENKRAIERADLIILLLPCGNGSHADWAYGVGLGKKSIVCGHPKAGDRSPVHLWADALVDTADDAIEWVALQARPRQSSLPTANIDDLLEEIYKEEGLFATACEAVCPMWWHASTIQGMNAEIDKFVCKDHYCTDVIAARPYTFDELKKSLAERCVNANNSGELYCEAFREKAGEAHTSMDGAPGEITADCAERIIALVCPEREPYVPYQGGIPRARVHRFAPPKTTEELIALDKEKLSAESYAREAIREKAERDGEYIWFGLYRKIGENSYAELPRRCGYSRVRVRKDSFVFNDRTGYTNTVQILFPTFTEPTVCNGTFVSLTETGAPVAALMNMYRKEPAPAGACILISSHDLIICEEASYSLGIRPFPQMATNDERPYRKDYGHEKEA